MGEFKAQENIDNENSEQRVAAPRARRPKWVGDSRFKPVSEDDPDFESKVLEICRDVVANAGARRHPSFQVLLETYENYMKVYIRREITKILPCLDHSKDVLEMKIQDVFNSAAASLWEALVDRKVGLTNEEGFTWFVKCVLFQACADGKKGELTRKRKPRLDIIKGLRRQVEDTVDPYERVRLQLEIEYEKGRERQYVYDPETIENLESPEPNPEELFQSKEFLDIILEVADKKVTNPHTRVYAEFIINGMNQETISMIQGVNKSAISKRMRAFKNEMRNLLDGMGIDPNI